MPPRGKQATGIASNDALVAAINALTQELAATRAVLQQLLDEVGTDRFPKLPKPPPKGGTSGGGSEIRG